MFILKLIECVVMQLYKHNKQGFSELAKSLYNQQHLCWNLTSYDLVGLANLNQQYTFLNLPKRFFMSFRKAIQNGWDFAFGFEYDDSSLKLPPFIEIELSKGDKVIRIVSYGDDNWSFAESMLNVYTTNIDNNYVHDELGVDIR